MNRHLLNERMKSKSFNVENLSSKIGISRATYFRKLAHDGDTFTVKEVEKICDILELSKDEVHEIFFE